MAITARQVGLATILLLLAPLQIVLQAQEALTIGWAELDTTKLDEGMSRLGVLIPKALIGVTSFITDRYVPQSEASLSSTRILSADLEKAKDAIATARRKRDLISLTGLDPFKRAADLRTAQSTLDKALADLEQLFLRQKIGRASCWGRV